LHKYLGQVGKSAMCIAGLTGDWLA